MSVVLTPHGRRHHRGAPVCSATPDADVDDVQVVVQGHETTVETGDRTALRVAEGAPVVF